MTASAVRPGELLRKMMAGRWWPNDPAKDEDAVTFLLHLHRFEESVQEIARLVAAMKDEEANDE